MHIKLTNIIKSSSIFVSTVFERVTGQHKVVLQI